MQIRSRDPLQLIQLLIKIGSLFLVSLIFLLATNFKTFRYIISVLGNVKILNTKGLIKGISCNGGLGTSRKKKPLSCKNSYMLPSTVLYFFFIVTESS